jgi:hypothetical protein
MNRREPPLNTGGLMLALLLLTSCAISGPTPAPTSIPHAPTPLPPTPTVTGTTRLLFVGNSLTFVNDLPGMFAELARSGGLEVEVDMSAQGGWTCADHATSAETVDKIEQHDWDFVILQEQSSLPALADQREEQMVPAIRLLDEKIRAGGADTVLFMTWGRRDGQPGAGFQDFSEMQRHLQAGYMELAKELDVWVAPVGVAWQHALAREPQSSLWQGDGLHPAQEGTYLSACVFYAVLFRSSPEGLSYRGGLPEERARFLQAIAAETVLEDPGRWNIQ